MRFGRRRQLGEEMSLPVDRSARLDPLPLGPPDGWLWRGSPDRPWTFRLSLDGRSYPSSAQFRAVRFDGPARYFTDETRPTDA